eukprot:gene1503-2133_t
MTRVFLAQTVLRYWLMHNTDAVHGEASLPDTERYALDALFEKRDADPYACYREAAQDVCAGLTNRMSRVSTGRFVASATILVCRYSQSENSDAYHTLVKTAIAERVDGISKGLLREWSLTSSGRGMCVPPGWRERIITWTIRQTKAPIPDKLYQLCTEFLLLSKHVPTTWGSTLRDGAIDRRGTTFCRNPATGILAHAAPERASDIRTNVQRQMQKIGETYRRRKAPGTHDEQASFNFEEH